MALVLFFCSALVLFAHIVLLMAACGASLPRQRQPDHVSLGNGLDGKLKHGASLNE